MIAESITVTTVGIGGDVDEQLLKMVADVGGGRYHQAPDPQSLPRIFTKETEMVAFDPEGENIPYHEELWPRVLMVAIGVFLLDLLLRRVRLFDRRFGVRRRRQPA